MALTEQIRQDFERATMRGGAVLPTTPPGPPAQQLAEQVKANHEAILKLAKKLDEVDRGAARAARKLR
jgi:hypothetical protein